MVDQLIAPPVEVIGELEDNPFNFELDPTKAVKGTNRKDIDFRPEDTRVPLENNPFDFDIEAQKERVPKDIRVSDPISFVINTAANFPGSTLDLAKAYAEPIIHPVRTAQNVKKIFNGFAELKAYHELREQNPNNPDLAITDDMRAAQSVLDYYAERYGDWKGDETDSWDVIGKKILRTIENDPAGFLGDLTMIFYPTGGITNLSGRVLGSVEKALGSTGKIGQTVTKTGQAITTAGTKIDPIFRTAQIGKAVGVPILNYMAGPGTTQSMNQAFKAGQAGGEANKSFRQAIKGKIKESDILKAFNKSVNSFKAKISSNFNSFANRIKTVKNKGTESIDFLNRKIDEIRKDLFEDVEVPTGNKIESKTVDSKGNPIESVDEINIVRQKKPGSKNVDVENFLLLEERLDRFKNMNKSDITDGDLLNLKQDIQSYFTPGNKYNDVITDANKLFLDDLNKIDTNTNSVFSSYSKMIDDLDDLVVTTGKSDRPQLQIGKLQTLLRDTPRGKVGLQEMDKLLKELDTNVLNQLGGQNLNRIFNMGGIKNTLGATGAGAVGSSGILGGVGVGVNLPLVLGLFGGGAAASSPRLLGNISNILGVGSRYTKPGVILPGMGVDRAVQQTAYEPFPIDPMDVSKMDYQINPNLFDPDFLAR